MEKLNDLNDLLKHEIQDLHSAEEQIIKAMPAMIEKAKNPELKQSLIQHLRITEAQLGRVEQVQNIMNDGNGDSSDAEEKKGLLSRLFKRNHVCKGMKGLIEEGEKVMGEDMNPQVMDAAIIACAQKIEHYEICGYGTARAYAAELNLTEVAGLLQQTLDEEYAADDKLTYLAVGRLNEKAEQASGNQSQSEQKTLSRNSRISTSSHDGNKKNVLKRDESPGMNYQIKPQITGNNKGPKTTSPDTLVKKGLKPLDNTRPVAKKTKSKADNRDNNSPVGKSKTKRDKSRNKK